MGKIQNIIAVMLCIAFFGNLSAQDNFYAVKIGTFVSPQHADFTSIQDIGFVYSDPKAFNHELISLGDFSSHAKAVESMLKVRSKGFPDATVNLIPMAKKERQIPVIQMATISASGVKNWASFFSAYSKIYARQLDNQLTIYAGGFDSIEGAKAILPFIKEAGFKGAFAQMIKTTNLQSVKELESGIRVEMASTSTENMAPAPVIVEEVFTAKSVEVPAAPIPQEAPAPVVVQKTLPVEGEPSLPAAVVAAPTPKAAPIVVPATPAVKVYYPSISGKVKRNAAIEIQKVLKAEKKYDGSLDGFYGPGTATAFEKFTKTNRQWRKYQMLTELWQIDKNATGADTWSEVKILKTILSEMNGGDSKTRSLKFDDKSLSNIRSKELKQWNESLWTNLTGWSKRDPMHAEVATVLKVAFFQTQVRIEEYFIEKGKKPEVARLHAIATLKAMVGKDLERFTE